MINCYLMSPRGMNAGATVLTHAVGGGWSGRWRKD